MMTSLDMLIFLEKSRSIPIDFIFETGWNNKVEKDNQRERERDIGVRGNF